MNTYQTPIRCVICGDGEITSSEGTTQGDSLAMAMYYLAIKPLIGKLKLDYPNVKQVWYADGASGADTCEDLRTFWNTLKPMVIYIWITPKCQQNTSCDQNMLRRLGSYLLVQVSTSPQREIDTLELLSVPDHLLKNTSQPKC